MKTFADYGIEIPPREGTVLLFDHLIRLIQHRLGNRQADLFRRPQTIHKGA